MCARVPCPTCGLLLHCHLAQHYTLTPVHIAPLPLLQGEAALFQDVKQADEQGNVSFTTAVRVCSDSARILRMNIHDFYPLVGVGRA
jgi:hypothetical protein